MAGTITERANPSIIDLPKNKTDSIKISQFHNDRRQRHHRSSVAVVSSSSSHKRWYCLQQPALWVAPMFHVVSILHRPPGAVVESVTPVHGSNNPPIFSPTESEPLAWQDGLYDVLNDTTYHFWSHQSVAHVYDVYLCYHCSGSASVNSQIEDDRLIDILIFLIKFMSSVYW